MSSQASTREEERRFNVRTLVFASIGAAAAAIITSQFWIAGTPIAAAITPVIVALVSEMLHRPTEKIAQKFTWRPMRCPRPPAPRRRRDEPEPPARDVTLYTIAEARRDAAVGQDPGHRRDRVRDRRRILTLPELISGPSLGKGNGTTSILGNNGERDKAEEQQPAEEQQQEQDPETVTETVPARAAAQHHAAIDHAGPAPGHDGAPADHAHNPTRPKAPAP